MAQLKSTRSLIPTEKGLEYQIDQNHRSFRSAISAWRRLATGLERLLSDSRNITDLKLARDDLDRYMLRIHSAYDRLLDLLPEEEMHQCDKHFDDIEIENHSLIRRVSTFIRELENGLELGEEEDRQRLMDNMDSASNAGSRHTGRSRASSTKSAPTHEKARIAELLVEREHAMDQEIEFRRRTLEIDTELAKARARERVYATSETNYQRKITVRDHVQLIAPADKSTVRLSASTEPFVARASDSRLYSEAPDSRPYAAEAPDSRPYAAQAPDSRPHAVQAPDSRPYATEAPDSRPYAGQAPEQFFTRSPDAQQFITKTPLVTSPSLVQSYTQPPVFQLSTLDKLLAALTEQVTLGWLPAPEPDKFRGDALLYPGWRSAFHILIERRGIPDIAKIHYLGRYVQGPAKDAINGFLQLTSPDTFHNAMKILDERYGDPFIVAGAFRDKLDNWPRISGRDGEALRRYSDFLRQCVQAMVSTHCLGVLNDERENHKMLKKIPEWLITRWGRIAANWREQHHTYPPFYEFAKFVEKEATIACDPITSLQSLKNVAATPLSEHNKPFNTLVRQSTWKFWPNLKLNDKVFFSFDYSSIGSQ